MEGVGGHGEGGSFDLAKMMVSVLYSFFGAVAVSAYPCVVHHHSAVQCRHFNAMTLVRILS